MSTITKTHPQYGMSHRNRMHHRRYEQIARVPGVLKANALWSINFDFERNVPRVQMIGDVPRRHKARSKYAPHQGKCERQRRFRMLLMRVLGRQVREVVVDPLSSQLGSDN